MILSRHDGIHQGQVEAGGGRAPGKPTSPGVGKPGCEQKQKRNEPDMIHMTEVHPGHVGWQRGHTARWERQEAWLDRHPQEGVAGWKPSLHNEERSLGGLSR